MLALLLRVELLLLLLRPKQQLPFLLPMLLPLLLLMLILREVLELLL